jgi:hypothetical protein
MKFLIVVLFATIHGDIFIFNNPTFDTREECMTAVVENPDKLIARLMLEYNRPMPIRGVNCVDTDTLNDLMEKYKVQIMPRTEKDI